MGQQISQSYTGITENRHFQFWTVHNASHKTTGEAAALWIMDPSLLKKTYKKKVIRSKYLDLQLAGILQMRKFRHPRILKVMEVVDKKPDIGFASERFTTVVVDQIKGMHPMDVAYIGFQLAEVFAFLHGDAHTVHMNLSPSAVLLDEQLSVKLADFQFASEVKSDGLAVVNQFLVSAPELRDIGLQPPELLGKPPGTYYSVKADVFLFGLFMYEAFTGNKLYESKDPDEILRELPSKTMSMSGIPAEFVDLLRACLQIVPESRPSFAEILQSPAFQSMQMKVLRYLDIMLTKEPEDKFGFYKGLAKKIDEFSPSLLEIKILPTLIEECKRDVRFAPILLGPIFQISQNYDPDKFMEKVWVKISHMATVTQPPEVCIGLLRNLWMLLDKVQKRYHKDYVYPIIFSALQSNNPRLHAECLDKMDLVVKEMNEDELRTLILPRLLELSLMTNAPGIVSAALMCVKKCAPRIDNDVLVTDFVPKFSGIWSSASTPEVAEAILGIFEVLKADTDRMVQLALPLACQISGNPGITGPLRVKYCNFIIQKVTDLRDQKETGFDGSSRKSDNPFGGETPKSFTAQIVPEPPAQEATNPFNESADDIFGASSVSKVSKAPPVENPFGAETEKPAAANNQDFFSVRSAAPKLESFDPFQGSPTTKPTPAAKPNPFGFNEEPQQPPAAASDFFSEPVKLKKPAPAPAQNDFFTEPKPAPSGGIRDIFGADSSNTGGMRSMFGGNDTDRSPSPYGGSGAFTPSNQGTGFATPSQSNSPDDLFGFDVQPQVRFGGDQSMASQRSSPMSQSADGFFNPFQDGQNRLTKTHSDTFNPFSGATPSSRAAKPPSTGPRMGGGLTLPPTGNRTGSNPHSGSSANDLLDLF